MGDSRISTSLASLLTSIVEERIGMHYEPHDLDIFSSKVVARALEVGFESLLDYYYFLRYDDRDGREFEALTESLLVGETYFFREARPLAVLVDDVVTKIVASGRRARIWSAACATGEEPLTLAMLLSERGLLKQVDIVASDISKKALARAEEGVFRGRSLRATTDEARARWFEAKGDGFRVSSEVASAITWCRVNLLEEGAIASLGIFDVIVCRNVLIYFSDATIALVTSRMAHALRPEGVLLVGASESLMRFGTLFRCEERGGAFFYLRAS
jgi:chemotaxis protein methyltransferase CheR